MADDQTAQAQYELPEGTGNNPQEDYNINFNKADKAGGYVTAEIQTGHGGVEGEWYTFDNTGKAIKADASDNDKCRIVFMLTEDTAQGVDGVFLKSGNWKKTGWGLAVNTHYWLSQSTPGAWTTTRPATGNIIRLGRADQDTETFHIQVSSEVEVIGVGGGIAHVVVGPDSGDDYPTISQACAGENPGTIIGVKQNALTEVGDITVKEGQSIIGMGGYHNGGTPGPTDDPSITVLMGDYRLLVPNDDYRIEGIVFDFTTTTASQIAVDIDGSNGLIRDCSFDFSGGSSLHFGMDVGSGVSRSRFVNIDFVCDANTIGAIRVSASQCVFRDINVTGGSGVNDDICKFSGSRNVIDTIRVSAPSSTSTSYGMIALRGEFNIVTDAYIEIGNNTMRGLLIATNRSVVNGVVVECATVSASSLIQVEGDGNVVTNFVLDDSVGNCYGIYHVNGHRCQYANGRINGADIGINVGGLAADEGVISNVSFEAIAGSWDISTGSTMSHWIVKGCSFDTAVNIGMDDCIVDLCTGSGVNVSTSGARLVFGNNAGMTYSGGTFVKATVRVHYATSDPGVGDDELDGFRIGDVWVNTTTPAFFYCSDPTATAAVWTGPSGVTRQLWDVLVDAGGAGDYTSIGAAITGLGGSAAIIGLSPVGGDITESADIVLANGQSIIGLGGVSSRFKVSMGDNRILFASKNNIEIEGVWFEFAPVVDESKIDIDALSYNIQFRKCVFAFTGTNQHSCIYDYGNYNRMIDIRIIGQTNSREALAVRGDESIYQRFRIVGGKSVSGAYMVSVQDAIRNVLRDFTIDGLGASTTAELVYVRDTAGTVKENVFDTFYLDDLSAISSTTIWRVEGTYDSYSRVRVIGGGISANIFWVRNDYNRFSDCYFEQVFRAIYLEAAADHNIVERCHINNATNRGVWNLGDDNCFTDITIDNTSGSYAIDDGGDRSQYVNCVADAIAEFNGPDGHIANCTFNLVDVLLGALECAFTNCTFQGTLDIADGADRCMFTGCDMDGTTNCTADTTTFSGCQMQTLNTAVTANVNGVMLSACRVSLFTNGSANNANFTRIAACQFGTFNDTGGFSTIRDEYTMENVTGNFSVRTSRHYHNEGAIGTVVGTLPGGPLDNVKLKATVMESQTLQLDAAAGDYIVIGDEISSAAGSVESNTPYSSIEFVVIEKGGADYWIAVNAIGTWTLS